VLYQLSYVGVRLRIVASWYALACCSLIPTRRRSPSLRTLVGVRGRRPRVDHEHDDAIVRPPLVAHTRPTVDLVLPVAEDFAHPCEVLRPSFIEVPHAPIAKPSAVVA
jgi:hypothetical protein